MAEDYRAKYLALEREFTYLKQTHELDIESFKEEFSRKEKQLMERIAFEQESANGRIQQAVTERDSQVDNLIEDAKSLQNRLLEADQIQVQLRH